MKEGYTYKQSIPGGAPEMECTSREIHVLQLVQALNSQLHEGGEIAEMEERLRAVPHGWQMYRSAVAQMGRVMDMVWDTLPLDVQLSMRRLYENGEVLIRPKPMVSIETMNIDKADLGKLINWLMEERCAICVATPAEQRGCEVRKTLRKLAPPSFRNKDKRCEYLEVCAVNELGSYVRERK